jgi:hypothetical protein
MFSSVVADPQSRERERRAKLLFASMDQRDHSYAKVI